MTSCCEIQTSGCTILKSLLRSGHAFMVDKCVPTYRSNPMRGSLARGCGYVMSVRSVSRNRRTPIVLGGGPFSAGVRNVMRSCKLPRTKRVSPAAVVSFFCIFFFKVVLSSTTCKTIITVIYTVLIGGCPEVSRDVTGSLELFFCYKMSALV